MAELIWNGELAEEKARKAAMEGLTTGAEVILTESKDQVPLDWGDLERSGNITTFERELAVYISYDTPYARRQHEDLSLNHPNGRKAKYLEDPFKKLQKKVLKLAQLKIDVALKS